MISVGENVQDGCLLIHIYTGSVPICSIRFELTFRCESDFLTSYLLYRSLCLSWLQHSVCQISAATAVGRGRRGGRGRREAGLFQLERPGLDRSFAHAPHVVWKFFMPRWLLVLLGGRHLPPTLDRVNRVAESHVSSRRIRGK